VTPLPFGWSWVTLDDLQADEPAAITDGPFGSHLTSAHYRDSGPRVVRLQNIGDGVFHDARAHIASDHFAQLRRHEVKPGDLLVASLGERLPRACLAPATLGPAIVKADCIRVRLHDRVESRWVLYAMQTSAIRAYAADQLHGVGRPRLGLKVIRSLPIPLPPLDEQRRIVDLLEDHLSRLDAADRALSASLARSERLLASWLSYQATITEAPRVPLGDLLAASLRHGRSVPTADEGFPVLRLTALRSPTADLSEHKIGAWSAAEAATFLVQADDFLVARGSGSLHLVGRGALVEPPVPLVAFPDTAIRVRVEQDLMTPRFLSLIWNGPGVRRQIEAAAKTTAGIHKVNQGEMLRILLPVPSLESQRQVVAAASALGDQTAKVNTEQFKTQVRSGNLRRSLLASAFSGRL
jgi:type I restriction enzyme S subunit